MTVGPGFLGVAGPTYAEFRRMYYEDDRWSLPPEGLQAKIEGTEIHVVSPNTDPSADPAPGNPSTSVPMTTQPPQPPQKVHAFSSAFSSAFDEVGLP